MPLGIKQSMYFWPTGCRVKQGKDRAKKQPEILSYSFQWRLIIYTQCDFASCRLGAGSIRGMARLHPISCPPLFSPSYPCPKRVSALFVCSIVNTII